MFGVFTTHAEQETTLTRVLFRVRRLCSGLQVPSNARRARTDTLVGVFSCSASFLHSTMHDKHEMTPVLVSFRAQILSCPLE